MQERLNSETSFEAEVKGPQWKLLHRIRNRITVEPLLFLYLFGGALWWPAYDALMYQKVCLMTIKNSTLCEHVESLNDEDENKVQSTMSRWQFWSNLIWDIPPLFLSFICGAIADNRSRRFVMAVPLVGISFFMGWMIINSIYMSLHIGWILLGSLNSITGGWISFHVGAYSYISAVSSEKDRTSYYALAECVVLTATAISLFISGIVLDKTNFVTVFAIPLILYVTCLLYIVIFLKEPKAAMKENSKFSHKKALSAFVCVFKKRPGKKRKLILILLACNATYQLASGVHHLNFLHLKHHPLAWSQTMYGYWRGVCSGVSAVTLLALVPLLNRKVRVQDTHLLMVSFVASGLSKIVLGLSTKTWMAFMVPFIDAVWGLGMTCKRSLISKFVDEDEVGQALAALTSLYSVMSLISSSIYNQAYPYTLHLSSGFLFYVSGGITIVPVILIWWLQRELATEESLPLPMDADTNEDTHNLVDCDIMSEIEHQPVQMESMFDLKVVQRKKDEPVKM